MKYEKPEVVKLSTAVRAIQGLSKGGPFAIDVQQPGVRPNTHTEPAYEADE